MPGRHPLPGASEATKSHSALPLTAAATLLLLLAACHAPTASSVDAIATRDSAGITIVQYSRAAVAGAPAWLPGSRLAALGGEGADATHDMTGVEVGLLEDTTFLVGDGANMQLRRFTASGKLIGTAAGKGDGPGELSSLSNLLPVASGVVVVDASRDALLIFGNSLRFRRQVSLLGFPGGARNGAFAMDGDDTVYASGGAWGRRPDPSAGAAIRRDPQVIERIVTTQPRLDTLFTLPGGEYYFIEAGTRVRRFGMRSFVYRTASGFVSGAGERWEVATRDASGQVRRLLRLDRPRRPVTEPMRAEQLRLDHRELDELPAGGFQDIRRMAAVDFANPRFPDSLPPYDKSRLGRDGTLWLRAGMAPTDSVQSWLVFHGDTLLGKLELPASTDLLAARRDRLLLRHVDSLGLGYVELRAIAITP